MSREGQSETTPNPFEKGNLVEIDFSAPAYRFSHETVQELLQEVEGESPWKVIGADDDFAVFSLSPPRIFHHSHFKLYGLTPNQRNQRLLKKKRGQK
jgi:hypothetical protein